MNTCAQLWFLNRWLDHLPCLHMADDGKSRFLFHRCATNRWTAICPRCQDQLTHEEAIELMKLLGTE